jgi:hypothetical protein
MLRVPEEKTMKTMKPIVTCAVLVALLGVYPLFAHSPVCNCYNNPDKTVTCEGGFSDGASAEGVPIRILDAKNKVLVEGKMDKESTFSFAKPPEDFHVVFDAGQGHTVTIFAEDIE